jgi:hypothetical protein
MFYHEALLQQQQQHPTIELFHSMWSFFIHLGLTKRSTIETLMIFPQDDLPLSM